MIQTSTFNISTKLLEKNKEGSKAFKLLKILEKPALKEINSLEEMKLDCWKAFGWITCWLEFLQEAAGI